MELGRLGLLLQSVTVVLLIYIVLLLEQRDAPGLLGSGHIRGEPLHAAVGAAHLAAAGGDNGLPAASIDKHAEPSPFPPRRLAVGVSLVLIQRDDLLKPMLDSLATSFNDNTDVTVFYWLNQPGSAAAVYAAAYKPPNPRMRMVEVPNPDGKNVGIVIPRMRIMEAMLAHQDSALSYFVEAHDDMLFFPGWFDALVAHDKPEYAILQPFLVNMIATKEQAQEVIKKYKVDDASVAVALAGGTPARRVLYRDCKQVHPWVLKRSALEDVGYYSEEFSPHEGEDDHFLFRLLVAGWHTLSVRSSWVMHIGGMTRGAYLPRETNHSAIFRNYFGGKGLDEMQNTYLQKCHPCVYALDPLWLGFNADE